MQGQQIQGLSRQQQAELVVPTKYCLYARKSSEDDERQALSIDSQIKEMLEMGKRENLEIADIRKESHSAKDSGQRPVLNQLVKDIRSGMFNAILTWAPDRLSRNAGDLGSIVDLMDQGHLAEIRTNGQRFTNSPNEKFLLMILCSQAKLENDHKGENVKRGLRAKCEMGFRPGVPPLGYIHDKYADKGQKRVLLDPDRAHIMKQIFERVAEYGHSGRTILRWLNNDMDFTTRSGKRMSLSRIYVILKDPFYYGEFEYPIGSGNWYKGKYDPIISKELFVKVQAEIISPPKRHPGTNEFEFTKLMYCGNCGCAISAEEKFKKQKNGNVHRYVYYHCSHASRVECREQAIREEELIRQLLSIIDKIDIDRVTALEKVQKDVLRYRKFGYAILGLESETRRRTIEIDVKNYAKYVLTEGSKDDKRELLTCLRSRLELKNKTITLKIMGN